MKVAVYERFEDDKGEVVEKSHEMWAVDAREAVRNDPTRFSTVPFAAGGSKGTPPQSHKVVKRDGGTFAVELNGREIKDGLTKDEAKALAAELDAA